LWTRSCMLAAGFALAGLMVILAAMYWTHRQDPLEASPQRINPNTASMASLVRLPGIGKARAMDIIHYRQNQKKNETVFLSAPDLQAIRGIGPKTTAALEPWLTFETEQLNQ
ncbi:MAG: ComEA family DNA-binding protein, partial [Planctomycetota bacterium]